MCNFEHECGKFSAVSMPDTGAPKTCVNACLIKGAGNHVLPTDLE